MLGKTKKNLALKITLGLVLALPVGTALGRIQRQLLITMLLL